MPSSERKHPDTDTDTHAWPKQHKDAPQYLNPLQGHRPVASPPPTPPAFLQQTGTKAFPCPLKNYAHLAKHVATKSNPITTVFVLFPLPQKKKKTTARCGKQAQRRHYAPLLLTLCRSAYTYARKHIKSFFSTRTR